MCLKLSCPVDCTTQLTLTGPVSARFTCCTIHHEQQLPIEQHNTTASLGWPCDVAEAVAATASFNPHGVINNIKLWFY